MPERGTAKLGVTGPVGSGKSTWVRTEMARRGWRAGGIRGFRTGWEGPRGAGGRLFLATWDGRVPWRGETAVPGKRPDAAGLAEAALAALESGQPGIPLAIDELGLFEAGDARLAAAVARALADAPEAIVVVQARALDLWRDVMSELDAWFEAGKQLFPAPPAAT